MSSSRDKLLGQFRELVLERLEKISRHLMALENGPDVEAGKAALRELHGLKGEARMMGFADINSIVHEMEEVVRAADKGGFQLDPASTDALLVCSDAVAVLSGAAPMPSTPPELPRLLEWLKARSAAEKHTHSGTPLPGPNPPAASVPAPAASPSAPPPQSSPPVAQPQASAPMPPSSAPGNQKGGASARSAASSDGRVDGTVKITQQSLDLFTTLSGSMQARNRRRELTLQRQFALSRELQQIHRLVEDLGPVASAAATRLARAKEIAAELHREGRLLANEELKDLTQQTEEIQALRMMPLSVLFEQYPRMVRELSRELGKEVELTIEGEDTRVDRSVLESLKEPLMHLVRNGLDHGLETREERVDMSKSPRGHLWLTAQREGERLLLRVQDDGRGLDPERLREVAVRKGLIDQTEADRLSDAAAMDLIFLPGFSSKDQVTDVSGRGVGLDVVRVRMVGLGGEVTVSSQIGRGASFELRVPISLTVAPLLFIEVGEERLCLQASSVAQALKVETTQQREMAGRPALSVEEGVLPFASISSLLGAAPERAANDGELVLVVRGRGQAAAIGVDRVLEERVQAVLPLKGVLSRYGHLSGATPLADGSLAMVLSAAHLVANAWGRELKIAGNTRARAESRKRRIMVVDDSPLTRELLVSLLEAVGYEIISANDGSEAIDRLGREVVDMVVTDLEMPKVDGLELTRRVKSHPTLRTLPVVIVTTRGAEADKRRGMEAGADGYITKGDLVRQDLVDVVARLLA